MDQHHIQGMESRGYEDHSSSYHKNYTGISDGSSIMTATTSALEGASSIKRRRESETSSVFSEDTSVKSHSESGESSKMYSRQNHRQIEKRRRDKMNTYINELTSLIPSCIAMSKKVDKLTVLRQTVQHLKVLKSSINRESLNRPQFLNDFEIESLLLDPSFDTNFLFAIDINRGKILYVSDSVKNVLGYSKNELLSKPFFDILHPKDIGKLKEQLLSSEMSNLKHSTPSLAEFPGFSCGLRRSFFCRMKTKSDFALRLTQCTVDKNYVAVNCTGYLKFWSSNKTDTNITDNSMANDGNQPMACLIIVARLQPNINDLILKNFHPSSPTFFSRFSVDGKFMQVDHMVTVLLGYLPHELEGSSIYEFLQYDDITLVSDFHKNSLKTQEEIITSPYRIKSQEGEFLWFETNLKRFLNPWTKEIECIIAKNRLIKWNDREQQQLVESSKKPLSSASLESTAQIDFGLQDEDKPCYSNYEETNALCNEMQKYSEDTSPNLPGANYCPNPDRINNTFSSCEQDDLSMSVIMSILENDAGLDGNVDFSNITLP